MNQKVGNIYYTRDWAGTPVYMAPEVLRGGGERYTFSADIWSFGALVAFMAR